MISLRHLQSRLLLHGQKWSMRMKILQILLMSTLIGLSYAHISYGQSSGLVLCQNTALQIHPSARAIGEIIGEATGSIQVGSLTISCQFHSNHGSDASIQMELVAPHEPFDSLALTVWRNSIVSQTLLSATVTCNMDDIGALNRPQGIFSCERLNVTYECGDFKIALLGMCNPAGEQLLNLPLQRRRTSDRQLSQSDVRCLHNSVMPHKPYSKYLGTSCKLANDSIGRYMYFRGSLLCNRCCAGHSWDTEQHRCIPCPSRKKPHVFTSCDRSNIRPSPVTTSQPETTPIFITTPHLNSKRPLPKYTTSHVPKNDLCNTMPIMIPKNLRLINVSAHYAYVACDPLLNDECGHIYTYKFQATTGGLSTSSKATLVRIARLKRDTEYTIRVCAKILTNRDKSSWSSPLSFRTLDNVADGSNIALWSSGAQKFVTVEVPIDSSDMNSLSPLGVKVRYKPQYYPASKWTIEQMPHGNQLTFELKETGSFAMEICVFDDVADGPWVAKNISVADTDDSASSPGYQVIVLVAILGIAFVLFMLCIFCK